MTINTPQLTVRLTTYANRARQLKFLESEQGKYC